MDGVGRRVAFIRGINVGRGRKVPMAELRAGLADIGFGNVRTYIQSGNVVYDGPADGPDSTAALRAEGRAITGVIGTISGIEPLAMVFTVAAVAGHLAASPYGAGDPAQAVVVFVDGDPDRLGDLTAYATAGEELRVIDGVIHLHCPNGLGTSKVAAKLAASTKVPTTTRNLRTIAKVLALAG